MILSQTFKGLLRDQIMNPPKWWFRSIDDLINAPSDYTIYVHRELISYFSMKKMSNYDPKFNLLMKRLKSVSRYEFGLEQVIRFWERKCGLFFTSFNFEQAKLILGNELAIDSIQFDHVLDVRSIRKDFQFSDKMVQL